MLPQNADRTVPFSDASTIAATTPASIIVEIAAMQDVHIIGLGDLYVTIFSGRTRRCGVLMGKGLNYDQVTEALAGITLESLVITRIMGNAIRRKAELGLVDLRDFPLLMHIVDILDHGKSDSDIPWEAFTFEHLK